MQNSFIIIALLLCCLFQESSNQLIGLLANPFSPSSIESAIASRALNRKDRAMKAQSGQMGEVMASGLETVLIRCKQDSDCIDDNSPESPENLMYCDRHYGFCDYFRQVGELCRHDSQCDSGLICMFGKCAHPVEPGQRGARCTDASDCAPGHCCARQHGELICKVKYTDHNFEHPFNSFFFLLNSSNFSLDSSALFPLVAWNSVSIKFVHVTKDLIANK